MSDTPKCREELIHAAKETVRRFELWGFGSQEFGMDKLKAAVAREERIAAEEILDEEILRVLSSAAFEIAAGLKFGEKPKIIDAINDVISKIQAKHKKP